VALTAFVLCSLCYARPAAAIPIFYQTGEDIFEAGPLPPPLDKDSKLAGGKAGYKCQVFGLFWAYMYWWDCHGVAFQGESYNSEPAVSAAVEKKYTQSSTQMSTWGAYGRFVIALALIGVVISRVLPKKKTD
jgi:hypothetical protein